MPNKEAAQEWFVKADDDEAVDRGGCRDFAKR